MTGHSDESREGWRHLPPTWVVEEVSRQPGAPIIENANEPLRLHTRSSTSCACLLSIPGGRRAEFTFEGTVERCL